MNVAAAPLAESCNVLPQAAQAAQHWQQLYGSSLGLALSELASGYRGLLIAVTASPTQAHELSTAVMFYGGGRIPLWTLPDWETLPYDPFSPHQDIISERLRTLYALPHAHSGVLITTVASVMQRLPPVEYLQQHGFVLQMGEQMTLSYLRDRLQQSGYRFVAKVMEHGEVAYRGALLDVFPMASRRPLRIEFLDDEVASLRTFNPDTQLTEEKLERLDILPASEYLANEQGINQFRRRFRESFSPASRQSPIYRDVSQGLAPAGVEYYLPLFFEQTASLFDYLPNHSKILVDAELDSVAQANWTQIAARFEQRRHDLERPVLPPEQLYSSPQVLREQLQQQPTIHFQTNKTSAGYAFATTAPPLLPITHHSEQPLKILQDFLAGFAGRSLFVVESPGRREILLETLSNAGIEVKQVSGWAEFVHDNARLGITVAPLSAGLQLDIAGLAVITEAQLWGQHAQQRRRRKFSEYNTSSLINNLAELENGDAVVHIDHGVGRYQGLTTLDVSEVSTEFLAIEYRGGDKLYVPVASLHLVSRYLGSDTGAAPWHRLGGDQWEKHKRKAAAKAHDVAAELLAVEARRTTRQGLCLNTDNDSYRSFAASFPFEETPDQASAIDAVLADMQSTKPMDRLVCGDVGFGKTEVAMRAAFAAAENGKQVAILVPTTLLARQHLGNFRDRFADWPIRVEALSRLTKNIEQTEIINGLEHGTVDIVIGTHKLLQREIKFKDLGLVIIDEEHRFGVRHKERLKALRTEVEVLTLTATPIPRTLSLSFAGLRDLSIIATPPAHRHAIKTFLQQWDPAIVREACQRELARGGQIYVIHNEIDTIEEFTEKLQEIVPEASIRYAHGQMRETELEHIMLNFYHQRFNCLVSTTIIESGIDIPTANTILIHRADRLGLAQLHQLRGRVGRSHHRAYAYLFSPPLNAVTADAKKRLEAIESLEDLGIGFSLATHDLEIRGAGEILGEDQSGQIQEIGYSLYTDLLQRAVHALKRGELPDPHWATHSDTEIELQLPALLPNDYVPDVQLRLGLYKRIADATSNEQLRELEVELIDRFGLLPPAAKNLLRSSRIKLRMQSLGLSRLRASDKGGKIDFTEQPQINPITLVKLVQNDSSRFRMQGNSSLKFSAELADPEQRFEFIEKLINKLAA